MGDTKQNLSAVRLVLLLVQGDCGGLLHVLDELVLLHLGDRALGFSLLKKYRKCPVGPIYNQGSAEVDISSWALDLNF